MTQEAGALTRVAPAALACPVCACANSPLERLGAAVLCPQGHSFDVARQGYVSLLTGAATKMPGDTPDMLTARDAFLSAGHFSPITAALSEFAGDAHLVLDVGAGTGHYLGAVLDAAPDALGVALDVSKVAARRAARAHPRAASIVADAWQRLPIQDGSCTHVLSVFAPRNPAEVRRVLRPDGRFIVVTPGPRHLAELVEPLAMVGVDPDKPRRLGDALAGLFTRTGRVPLEFPMPLHHTDIAAVAAMGPSAHHRSAERAALLAALPDPLTVTASVVVSVYTPI